jgi:hypothetical protein
MHHDVWMVLVKKPINLCWIANIYLLEAVTFTGRNIGKGLQVPGVSELVDIYNLVIGMIDQKTDNGRPDKTCTTGY